MWATRLCWMEGGSLGLSLLCSAAAFLPRPLPSSSLVAAPSSSSSLQMARWLLVALACCALLAGVTASRVSDRLRSKMTLQPQSTNPAAAENPFDAYPHMSMLEYHTGGALPGDDAFSQVRSVIGTDEEIADSLNNAGDDESAVSFVESGAQVGKVRSFCEICILVMQMKERGQPHLCAGLNTNYHITCIEALESILRADKAVVYWLRNGCMHMDSERPDHLFPPCRPHRRLHNTSSKLKQQAQHDDSSTSEAHLNGAPQQGIHVQSPCVLLC